VEVPTSCIILAKSQRIVLLESYLEIVWPKKMKHVDGQEGSHDEVVIGGGLPEH